MFSSQNIWIFFCSHTVRTLYIIEEIAIVGRTSRGECGVCAAGKDISSLRSVLIRIFILLSLIRNNFSLIVLGESKDGAHRQPGAQQQHWHRRHGKCDWRYAIAVIVERTSRGECGVAGKDIYTLRSVLIRIFIWLSLIRYYYINSLEENQTGWISSRSILSWICGCVMDPTFSPTG